MDDGGTSTALTFNRPEIEDGFVDGVLPHVGAYRFAAFGPGYCVSAYGGFEACPGEGWHTFSGDGHFRRNMQQSTIPPFATILGILA